MLSDYPAAAVGAGDGSDEATDSDDLGGGGKHKSRRRFSKSGGGDDSRRMFQKLWTDADEIKVLEGFLEFTSRRGTTHADYQHDTGPFFDEIRPRLKFEFNKNQVAEKLRRLKRKYRNAAARIGSGRAFVFKSPHDRDAYEISRKIWSTTFKRKPKNPDTGAPQPDWSGGAVPAAPSGSEPAKLIPVLVVESSAGAVQSNTAPDSSALVPQALPSQARGAGVEETMRMGLAPMFKELLQFAVGGYAPTMTASPLGFLPPSVAGAEEDERWRRQRILELEVYLKRIELVEESVRSALEKLRSTTT
ncbi:Mediator-associated protein 1 [Apostasia shenzhenica]|uniref:Mediator-associated protein 1 n=1 Tax=Apostasia shenzhenica TaxID=1088818 RepID=A0A2I0A7J6_9ASPA|nr:Mediator-associated protein 1 [Apostasia shenzhenica]